MQDLKGFIMFLTIVISIYVLTNLYVYIKGSLALSITGFSFWVYTALFIIVAILFPLSFFLRHTPYCGVCTLVTILGSIWLGAMFYFFLIGVLVDGVRLIDFFSHVIPTGVKERSVALGRGFFVAAIVAVTLICALGYRHSVSIKLKEVDFAVKNLPDSSNPLSIVFLSDVHIGVLIRENRLEKIIAMANLGATIIVVGDLPSDVPGLGNLSYRQSEFRHSLSRIRPKPSEQSGIQTAALGAGRSCDRRAVHGGDAGPVLRRGASFRAARRARYGRAPGGGAGR